MIGARPRPAAASAGEVADVLIAAEYPIYGRFGYGPAVRGTIWELVEPAPATRYVRRARARSAFVDNATYRKEAPAVFDRVRLLAARA